MGRVPHPIYVYLSRYRFGNLAFRHPLFNSLKSAIHLRPGCSARFAERSWCVQKSVAWLYASNTELVEDRSISRMPPLSSASHSMILIGVSERLRLHQQT